MIDETESEEDSLSFRERFVLGVSEDESHEWFLLDS